MIRRVSLLVFWFTIWILLSWPPETKDVVIGLLAAALVTFMTIDLLDSPAEGYGRRRGIASFVIRFFWLLCYVAIFLWECLKANIDVASRVLHPDVPIRPGTVKVKTHLKSDIGLTFLASSITLTPGTTTVDVDKDNGYIYVHWLYVKKDYDALSMSLPVVEKFENILRKIFE